MTAAPKPRMHGRDHSHGGPDPWLLTWEDVGPMSLADLILTTPDLSAFWKLNEATGTTAADSSGHGHHLTSSPPATTPYKPPTWGQPPIVGADTSAGFRAGAWMERLVLTGYPSLGNTGDFTAMIYFRRLDTLGSSLMGQGDAVMQGSQGWLIGINQFNSSPAPNVLYLLKGTSSDDLWGGPVWAAGATHLAAVTFVRSTNTWTLYLDGAAVASEVDPFDASGGVWIGAANPPSQVSVPRGDAAYAATFTRALTAAELVAFWEAA